MTLFHSIKRVTHTLDYLALDIHLPPSMADHVNVEYLLNRNTDSAASTISSISSSASTWLADALSTASASVVSASSAASVQASSATESAKSAASYAAHAVGAGRSSASWAEAKHAILAFAAASLGSVYNVILLAYLVFIVLLVFHIIRVSILRLPSATALVTRPNNGNPLEPGASQQERLAFATALREWHRIETVVRQKPIQVFTFVLLSVISLTSTWYQ